MKKKKKKKEEIYVEGETERERERERERATGKSLNNLTKCLENCTSPKYVINKSIVKQTKKSQFSGNNSKICLTPDKLS